jgi:hypothetical protein
MIDNRLRSGFGGAVHVFETGCVRWADGCAALFGHGGAGVPDIAIEHPATFFFFPDDDVFAGVDGFVVGAVKGVFLRF